MFSAVIITISFRKYPLPLFAHYCEAKVGQGLEYSIHLMHTPLPSIPHNNGARLTIATTAMAFWKNGSFTEHVLQEISAACILSREASKQFAPSVVTGGDPAFLVKETKTLVVASEQGYSNFVRTCLRTQSMTGLNQKLTKSMPRRCSMLGDYMREKYLYKNLGVKERGRVFAHIFGNLLYYGMSHTQLYSQTRRGGRQLFPSSSLGTRPHTVTL